MGIERPLFIPIQNKDNIETSKNSLSTLTLILSYNGKNYHGFQKQSNAHLFTVQGKVESAIIKIFPSLQKVKKVEISRNKKLSKRDLTDFKTTPLTLASGRTDKGVHANEQVVNVYITNEVLKIINQIGLATLPTVINHQLPDDIRVLRAYLTHAGFNPRYAGRVRYYRYQILQIYDHPKDFFSEPKAIQGNFYYCIRNIINLDKLNDYFIYLVGTHDFTSFSSWSNEKKKSNNSPVNPIRTIYKIDLIPRGKELYIDIYANSFLKSMVRSIIGNVLHCYQKNVPPEIIQEILQKKDNQFAKKRAPAYALFLRRIYFSSLFHNDMEYKKYMDTG